jgi:hypothetical protein
MLSDRSAHAGNYSATFNSTGDMQRAQRDTHQSVSTRHSEIHRPMDGCCACDCWPYPQ